jgi:hypothetical protein
LPGAQLPGAPALVAFEPAGWLALQTEREVPESDLWH